MAVIEWKFGLKKDRDISLLDYDNQVKDIRLQLNEQLKCLDSRLETQVSIVGELQEYYRRRAEVELDYSKALDKLGKNLLMKHKEQKQKREHWHLYSTYNCWEHLINSTKRQSRNHAVLSDIYGNNITSRFSYILDDAQRVYKKCREISFESHEELLKVLHELHTAMKTYHGYHIEFKTAENKMKYVEGQRNKFESTVSKEKLLKSKKFRVIEKELEKRRIKYHDAKLRSYKARNEYLLCMEAANAATHKYYVDDLSDIMDCMDLGLHNSIAQAILTHISAEDCVRKSQQMSTDAMSKCVNELDCRVDKQKFLECNNSCFMIPKKFEFQGNKSEEMSEVGTFKTIKDDLEFRYQQLTQRLTTLKTESEEVWKTLETAERSLVDMVTSHGHDVSLMFREGDKAALRQPEVVVLKQRADRQETEDFYLSKFREYILSNNLMTRLQAKYELIRKALGDNSLIPSSPSSIRQGSGVLSSRPPRKKRIGRVPMGGGQPKLFGGSLEEYLEAADVEIPLVMKSCIRVINLYGLHHQGIFRVSGAQVEINGFKESFERGEDPLADMNDASDINSVAGLLKLYLRELREPMFPTVFFEQFMELAQLESRHDFVMKVKDVIQSLPRSVFVVLRYLFSFLNHLSEFSDENMMDPYNLAICFGPTLVPIPEDKDQVQYQNLVNELIKNIIIYTEDIFPSDGGTLYEKYISDNLPDELDVGEAPSEPLSDDMDSEIFPSEDENAKDKDITLTIFGKSEILEAVAQFDFTARSSRELTFKKSDHLLLYSQVSSDWWRGSYNGKEGLIPDKYVLLRIKDEEKDKGDKVNSEDGYVRRSSISSDSLLSTHSGSTVSLPPASDKIVSKNGAASQSNDSLLVDESFVSPAPASEGERQATATTENCDREEKDPTTRHSYDETLLHNRKPTHRRQQSLEASKTYDLNRSESEAKGLNFRINRNLWEKRSSSHGHLNNPELSVAPVLHSDVDPESSAIVKRKEKTHFSSNKRFWEQKSLVRSKQTPDLVMDLPVSSLSCSPKDSSELELKTSSDEDNSGSEVTAAPESPDMTTAERFAKTNQCTLKKNSAKHNPSEPQVDMESDPEGKARVDGPFYEVVSFCSSTNSRASNVIPGPDSVTCSDSPLSTNTTSFKPQLKMKPMIPRKPPVPQKPSPELSRKSELLYKE